MSLRGGIVHAVRLITLATDDRDVSAGSLVQSRRVYSLDVMGASNRGACIRSAYKEALA